MNQPNTSPSPPPRRHRMWIVWMLFFFQFAAIGTYFTYLNMFYRQAGLSGTQIGINNMVAALVGMGGAVVWGNISDRTGKNRLIIAGGALGSLLVAQIVPLVHGFWPYLFLSCLGSLAGSSASTLVDSTALVMLGDRREDYGRYRLGGSVGYIVTASSVGFLFDRTGLGLMFPIYGILMVFFMISALLLPNLAVHREARDLRAVRVMIRQPDWLLFTGVVFLVWIASNAAITFMSVVLQSMGMKSGLIGVAVTVGAVVEMPFMIFSGNLLRRFGPVKLILVSMGLSVIRFSLLGLMKVPEWAVAINLLNGPAYVLFWTSAVNLASRLAPQGLTATAQGLLNSTTSMAGVVSALLSGWLFDRLHNGLFEVMAAFCLVGLVSFAFGNLRRRPAPAPETREAQSTE